MKKGMAMLLMLTLLVTFVGCGEETEPTAAQTQPVQTEPTETTAEATQPQQTEPTQEQTVPQQTEPSQVETQPQQTEPVVSEKVTVYLLEETSIFDYGYQKYIYDDNDNVIAVETYSLEDVLQYKLHLNEQDANGMFCQIVEEWDGDSQYRTLAWFEDGKLQEVQYNPGFSGDQYAYDAAGNMTELRNYYDGILDYAVYFEYDGEVLQRAYSENPEGQKLSEFKIVDGRVVGKDHYDADGTMYYSYEYRYDANGNLEQKYFIMDGESSPSDTHSYRAVEVDAARANYLIAQQQYLLDIYHN